MLQRFTDTQRKEVAEWTGKLRSADSNEIAAILASAMHYRNLALSELNLDLMYPFVVAAADPTIALKINRDIQQFQRDGGAVFASGAIVWLFTVRAALDPDLRESGRLLWRQLKRGFSGVDEAAGNLLVLANITLDITGAGRFPDGFTPEPV